MDATFSMNRIHKPDEPGGSADRVDSPAERPRGWQAGIDGASSIRLRRAVADRRKKGRRIGRPCRDGLAQVAGAARPRCGSWSPAAVPGWHSRRSSLFSCTSVARESAPSPEAGLPIGQPIPSWHFVLGPEGGWFRLVILSDYIAKGYVDVPSPQFATITLFGRQTGAFDTGDYFRRVGTQLHFSHRRDTMVKVHGVRIDLGEIEAAARRCGFLNPVALVVDDLIALTAEAGPAQAEATHPEEGADIRMTSTTGASMSSTTAVEALSRHLPRTSLPAEIRLVPAQPRTISGKLDRRAIQQNFGPIRVA